MTTATDDLRKRIDNCRAMLDSRKAALKRAERIIAGKGYKHGFVPMDMLDMALAARELLQRHIVCWGELIAENEAKLAEFEQLDGEILEHRLELAARDAAP